MKKQMSKSKSSKNKNMATSKKPAKPSAALAVTNVPTTFSEVSPNRLEWVFGAIPIGEVIKQTFIQWYTQPDFSDMSGRGIEELSALDSGTGYRTYLTFNTPSDPNTWPLANGTYQMRIVVSSGIRELSTDVKLFVSDWITITIGD